MMRYVVVHWMSVCLLGVIALADEGTLHTLKFHRFTKVGDRHRVSLVSAYKRESTYIMDGQRGRTAQSLMGTELHGTKETLEVDQKGDPIRSRYTIGKCVTLRGAREDELLKPSQVLIVEAIKDGTRITLEGGALSESTEGALRLVLKSRRGDTLTSDDYYGPGKPQPVGATWPVNRVFLESVRRWAPSLSPHDIQGSVTLAGLEDWEQIRCYNIRIDVEWSNLPFPAEAVIADGMKPRKVTRLSRQVRLIPVDLNLDSGSSTLTDVHTYLQEGQRDGKAAAFEQKVTHIEEERCVLLRQVGDAVPTR